MATAKQTKKQVAQQPTKPGTKPGAKRKATPKGAEQVRRNAKYHDNDGETVGSSDAPRKRFGDTGKRSTSGAGARSMSDSDDRTASQGIEEGNAGRETESQKESKRRRASGRSIDEEDAATRSGSVTRTRR